MPFGARASLRILFFISFDSDACFLIRHQFRLDQARPGLELDRHQPEQARQGFGFEADVLKRIDEAKMFSIQSAIKLVGDSAMTGFSMASRLTSRRASG